MLRIAKALTVTLVLVTCSSGATFAQPYYQRQVPDGYYAPPPSGDYAPPAPGYAQRRPVGPPGPGFRCSAGPRPIICELPDPPRPLGSPCACETPFPGRPPFAGRVIR